MSDRFIKFLPDSQESKYLLQQKPNAFLLLSLIATRVKFKEENSDGLHALECHIGDHESCGLSRQEYRTALNILIQRKHIHVVETCRTRKKSTTGTTTGSTTEGTLVKLIGSNVYEVNIITINHPINHPINHRPTTDQPPTNHEQECKNISDVVVCYVENIFGVNVETLETLIEKSILLGKNWSTEEMQEAYKIIFSYKENVTNTFSLFEGIILKRRNLNLNKQKKELKCQKKTQNQSEVKKKSIDYTGLQYRNGTKTPPLAALCSQNGRK